MTKMLMSSRLADVNHRIELACDQAQRARSSVTLLAVSKTKPLADLVTAYQAGQRHFAENYAQEAVDKAEAAPFDDAIWHFIGPLQSNKSRGIAEQFDWLHSMDRFKLAQRLNDQRPAEKAPLNVLIQVNISQDPAKSGVKPDQVAVLATQILALPRLQFRGLMAIPAADLPLATLTAQFQELKRLQQSLIKDFPECTELSIGMSGDFPTAIDCGATMVRIGTDIFGAR